MYYVYVLKSKAKNWVYIGNTDNLERRITEHENGAVKSTKFYKPFDLLFVQIVEDRAKARDLEKFLKVRFNKESLLGII